MSISRILRTSLFQASEIGEAGQHLITNKPRSAVAEKQVRAEIQQKKNQLKKYKNSPLSELSNKKYLARHGWGIGSIRKYSIVNKSKISGQWKLFFYTYRTNDQIIRNAAREGRNKVTLETARIQFSRAISNDEFETKHIGRRKPTFPDALKKRLIDINKLDGSMYREKFLKKECGEPIEYIAIDSANEDTKLTQLLSGISTELNKKLQPDSLAVSKNPRPSQKNLWQRITL